MVDDERVIADYQSLYVQGVWELDFFEHMVANRLRAMLGLQLVAWEAVERALAGDTRVGAVESASQLGRGQPKNGGEAGLGVEAGPAAPAEQPVRTGDRP